MVKTLELMSRQQAVARRIQRQWRKRAVERNAVTTQSDKPEVRALNQVLRKLEQIDARLDRLERRQQQG
jgi:hypothetical protein